MVLLQQFGHQHINRLVLLLGDVTEKNLHAILAGKVLDQIGEDFLHSSLLSILNDRCLHRNISARMDAAVSDRRAVYIFNVVYSNRRADTDFGTYRAAVGRNCRISILLREYVNILGGDNLRTVSNARLYGVGKNICCNSRCNLHVAFAGSRCRTSVAQAGNGGGLEIVRFTQRQLCSQTGECTDQLIKSAIHSALFQLLTGTGLVARNSGLNIALRCTGLRIAFAIIASSGCRSDAARACKNGFRHTADGARVNKNVLRIHAARKSRLHFVGSHDDADRRTKAHLHAGSLCIRNKRAHHFAARRNGHISRHGKNFVGGIRAYFSRSVHAAETEGKNRNDARAALRSGSRFDVMISGEVRNRLQLRKLSARHDERNALFDNCTGVNANSVNGNTRADSFKALTASIIGSHGQLHRAHIQRKAHTLTGSIAHCYKATGTVGLHIDGAAGQHGEGCTRGNHSTIFKGNKLHANCACNAKGCLLILGQMAGLCNSRRFTFTQQRLHVNRVRGDRTAGNARVNRILHDAQRQTCAGRLVGNLFHRNRRHQIRCSIE